ncbi:hypothetical protein MUP51_09845, partial [Candidatus Bathyarchaeota archaeon]|nr:hypothetical protein [Candidatus Bathyarchaeota archaeon]
MTDERVIRETVRRGTVTGDLIIEDGRVEAENGKLQVTGAIRCERDCELIGEVEAAEVFSRTGDVTVRGSLKAGKVELKDGRLNVSESLISEEIRVSKSLDVGGELQSDSVRVGGSLEVKGDVVAGRVKVGGTFHADRNSKVDYVDVGGSYSVYGKASSKS